MASLSQTLRALLQSLHASETRRAAMSRTTPPDAETCAFELLTSNLSPVQRYQYENCGYFDVIGGDTGKRYRIRHGSMMNVDQLDHNGRRTQLLCFMPKGGLPAGDVLLAQKIALELFETDAIRVANRSPNWDLDYELRRPRRYRR